MVPDPMTTFEDELRRSTPLIRLIVGGFLLGKRIVVRGREHIPRTGPVLLIGNHCGAYKDAATIYRVAPRPIFYNANRMLFNRAELDFLVRKHLKRHLGRAGLALDLLLGPFKALFVRFASTNIARFGTIPVDMYNLGRRGAVEMFKDYLRQGRALVSLQGRGRVHPEEPNPYMKPFGRGVAYIAASLEAEEGLSVPVVPLAFFGTQRPWGIPGRIDVNVGPPRFARDFFAADLDETVERFTLALQTDVHRLILEIIRSRS
jgi:1-acyl-sn-glycerol-3-phosphate acyltransferase